MTYEFEGKTEKEAIEMAVNELGLERDQFDVEILETQKNSIFKKGYVKIRVHTLDESNNSKVDHEEKHKKINAEPIPQDEFEQKLIEFIATVIKKMGYEAKVDISYRENKKIGIRIESPSSSILIVRKGKNLDALPLLANIYAGIL